MASVPELRARRTGPGWAFRASAFRASAWLVLACLALATAPVSADGARGDVSSNLGVDEAGSQRPRIVAIADVHGALEPFRAILRQAGLIDEADRWIGGDTILVQTGDLLDRGKDVRAVIDLVRSLEEQAPEHGGRVVALLGNHETMNMLLDLRDLNPESLAPWIDRRSERRRAIHCRRFVDIERLRAEKAGRSAPRRRDLEAGCVERTPLGLLEYLQDLRPDEDLGRWLRARPTVARIDDWIFVHGGLSPALEGAGVDSVNARVRQELDAFDQMRRDLMARGLILPDAGLEELVAVARGLRLAGQRAGVTLEEPSVQEIDAFLELGDWWVLSPRGPLWFRGWAKDGPEKAESLLAMIRAFGAERAVGGHTPRSSRSIESRFGGRIYLIDTGMLSRVYRGRASALEIVDGRVSAIYEDGDRQLLDRTDNR